MEQQEDSLIVTAGADTVYQVPLESPEPHFFADLSHEREFDRNQLDVETQGVLEQLLLAGVVVPLIKAPTRPLVAMRGDWEDLALTHPSFDLSMGDDVDFLIAVRAQSTYADLLTTLDYGAWCTPHLLVDVAFHHTIAIGPLVFPGETACLMCLQGRLAQRWGDPTPPPSPLVPREHRDLIAALAADEIARALAGDTTLVNTTVSWNLADRTTTSRHVLKVPTCPVCHTTGLDSSGKMAPGQGG